MLYEAAILLQCDPTEKLGSPTKMCGNFHLHLGCRYCTKNDHYSKRDNMSTLTTCSNYEQLCIRMHATTPGAVRTQTEEREHKLEV